MQLALIFDQSEPETPQPIVPTPTSVSSLSRAETIARLRETRQQLMQIEGFIEKSRLHEAIAELEQHLDDEKQARAIEREVCKQGFWR